MSITSRKRKVENYISTPVDTDPETSISVFDTCPSPSRHIFDKPSFSRGNDKFQLKWVRLFHLLSPGLAYICNDTMVEAEIKSFLTDSSSLPFLLDCLAKEYAVVGLAHSFDSVLTSYRFRQDCIDAFDKLEKSYLDRHEDLDQACALLARYQAVDDIPLQRLVDQLRQMDQLEITCLAMEDEL